MNISIIIPNYNGENLLKKNLPKVIEAGDFFSAMAKEEIEVIIVDDQSTDGSMQYIKDQISKIKNTDQKSKIILRLINNDKNLGFSSTVNRGVREASGEVVILLNTDVAPQKDFLEPLVQHFEDDKVFAVGSMDKSVEDGKVILRGRGIGKWERGFLVHTRGEVNKNDTLWVSGGSGAFRKDIWEKLGGFCELYSPFYWEDIDISYRALKSGYKVVFEPKSIVFHEHEKGIIKQKYSKFQVKRIAYRNQFMFVWVNADLKHKILNILWLPYHFFKTFTSLDIAFFLGFLDAFIKLPQVIRFNFRRKNFLKKDEEIIKIFYN